MQHLRGRHTGIRHPGTAGTDAAPPETVHRFGALCAAIGLIAATLGLGVLDAPHASAQTGGQIAAPGLTYEMGSVAAVSLPSSFVAPTNTDFSVVFDGTVSADVRPLVESAAGIWSSVLDVDVPIVLDVSMEALGAGYLGAAGPTTAFWGYDSFPSATTLYPSGLANQFAGRDLDPDASDIDMVLSSAVPWNLSTDGSGSGQSLLSVVLHELGHGLGLTSWVHEEDGVLTATYRGGGSPIALRYDELVSASSGAPLISLSGPSLSAALTAPLHWRGPNANATNGAPVRLYSPSVFALGSSVGHLDEGTFTSELMTPFLGAGEPHAPISALTKSMLRDIGWTMDSTGTAPPPADTSTSSGGSQASVYATAYVNAVAQEFVGRPATEAELGRWVPWLLGGGSRSDVTFAFANSPEWVGVLVDGLYQSTLGRGPDASGKAFWVATIRAGMTPAQAAAEFYASDEYFGRAGGTATGWVTDLYAEILHRTADGGGLAHWVARSLTVSRQDIAHDFYQSLESRRDRVAGLFEDLLGRSPDAGGWAYWAERLANGRDVELATLLAASDEFLNRALAQFKD